MTPTAGSSTAEPAAPPHPRFYFDVASPEAYLVAERILTVMPVATEWVPVHLPDAPGPDWDYVEAQVAARGMQALVRPPAFDAELVDLAATYAKQIGRTVSFAQAAFRQAFAGGRDLSKEDWVVIAGSACEMHPTATLKAVTTRLVRDGLVRATAQARALGVERTPALVVGDRVLHGDAALEDAAALAAEHAA